MPSPFRRLLYVVVFFALACVPEEELSAVDPFKPNVLYDTFLTDFNDDPDIVEVQLEASWSKIEIAEGYRLNMMTYNGSFPGPLLQANVGDKVIVHFTNNLDQPTTIHWHGLRISDAMDGTPRVQDPIEPGDTFLYEFVVPDSGTFWYHPHVRSDEQVERGLYGPMIVHDPALPKVDAERIIIVDDILLNERGDDLYPFDAARFGMHGRMGNLLLSNGRVDYQNEMVRFGSVERWRIINTSNARTFILGVDGVAKWKLIGTDGGPVSPLEVDRLMTPVGQRYEVLVTHGLRSVAQLTAYVPALNQNNEVVEYPIAIYRIPVAESDGTASPYVEWPDRDLSQFANRAIDREVNIVLNGVATDQGIAWTINGMQHPMEPLFTFERGETVLINISNEAGPEHPFHLHGQFFEIVPDGRFITEQVGLKDTVLVPGITQLQIRAYMDNPGRWMAHCHILEHAKLGMMAEIVVND